MAEKSFVLILTVDLDCRPCYKKIRKILCKLQDKERIRTISYDNGSKTIAVVGPFDPHRLSCKIRCMAGKVIKGVEIITPESGGPLPQMEGPPQPQPVNNGNGKKKHKEKPRETEPPPPPPQQQPVEQPPPPMQHEHEQPPPMQHGPPDSHIAAGMPAMVEEMHPGAGERPAMLESEPPIEIPPLPAAPPPEMEEKMRPRERLQPRPIKPAWGPPIDVGLGPPASAMVEIPSWPAAPMAPCGCPCYQGYYEGCRCAGCGRVYGYAVTAVPAPSGCYGGGGYRPLFVEEDPSSACAVM